MKDHRLSRRTSAVLLVVLLGTIIGGSLAYQAADAWVSAKMEEIDSQ
jgi:hypothetical protein